MSAKLKQLKERKGELTKQLRAANDALSAAPQDPAKQKDWNDRSAEMINLAGEIEREERVSALEELAPDKRGGVPGGTNPGQNPLQEGRDKEPDNPILDPDKHGYSLLRAMRMQCGLEAQNGVEWEIHTELSKNRSAAGATVRGVMVPHTLRMRGAQLRGTVTGLTAGAGLIPTILAPMLIDILRDRVVLRSLGCQVLSDMVGAFKVPKKTAKVGFEWVAEATAATATDVVVGTVDFSEKTLTGWTKITRSFMKQSSQDAELLVRNDLIDGMAVGLDNGGINGTGSSNQPTGLLAVSGTNSVAIGTNGGAVTWAKAIELQTAVGTANAVGNRPAYLTNSKVMGAMKTIPKVASTSIFIMEDGEVDGREVAESNLVPSNLTKGSSSGVCSALLYGDFSNLIMALWGGLDIVVDPYTLSTAGDVRVTAFQSADVNVRHAAAFSKCVDLTT